MKNMKAEDNLAAGCGCMIVAFIMLKLAAIGFLFWLGWSILRTQGWI